MAASQEKLHNDVFEKFKIETLDFSDELPSKMTKEMYIQIYRKIWATIRHDLYNEV